MACILASKAARCWPSSPKSSWANHQAYSVNNNQTPRMCYGWWGTEYRWVEDGRFFENTIGRDLNTTKTCEKLISKKNEWKWATAETQFGIWERPPTHMGNSSKSMGSPACIKTKTCNLKMKSSSKSSWLWVPPVCSRGCLKQHLAHILSLQASKTVQKLPLRAMNMAVLIQKQREFLPIKSPMVKQHKT